MPDRENSSEGIQFNLIEPATRIESPSRAALEINHAIMVIQIYIRIACPKGPLTWSSQLKSGNTGTIAFHLRASPSQCVELKYEIHAWAPVSEPGFSDFQIFRLSILDCFLFLPKICLTYMLVRYRGINNKGVMERPWTIWKVLIAISSTLRFQFTVKCWKVDFLTSSKTRSCKSSKEKLRMLSAPPPGHP